LNQDSQPDTKVLKQDTYPSQKWQKQGKLTTAVNGCEIKAAERGLDVAEQCPDGSHEKAAEDRRTPGRFARYDASGHRASVLECARPRALWARATANAFLWLDKGAGGK